MDEKRLCMRAENVIPWAKPPEWLLDSLIDAWLLAGLAVM